MIIKDNSGPDDLKRLNGTYLICPDDAITKEELNTLEFKPLIRLKIGKLVAKSLSFNKAHYLVEDEDGLIHSMSIGLINKIKGIDNLPEIEGIEDYYKNSEKEMNGILNDEGQS